MYYSRPKLQQLPHHRIWLPVWGRMLEVEERRWDAGGAGGAAGEQRQGCCWLRGCSHFLPGARWPQRVSPLQEHFLFSPVRQEWEELSHTTSHSHCCCCCMIHRLCCSCSAAKSSPIYLLFFFLRQNPPKCALFMQTGTVPQLRVCSEPVTWEALQVWAECFPQTSGVLCPNSFFFVQGINFLPDPHWHDLLLEVEVEAAAAAAAQLWGWTDMWLRTCLYVM